MMMMMRSVMCVLAVVLCCACGYTMAAAAAVDNDSPSGRGVSRGAVEVSCGAGGALRVRPAAASEWLTCGAGSRVSACGKYADLCSQRTARAATIKTKTIPGQPKAMMANDGVPEWDYFLKTALYDKDCFNKSGETEVNGMNCAHWNTYGKVKGVSDPTPVSTKAEPLKNGMGTSHLPAQEEHHVQLQAAGAQDPSLSGSTAQTTLTGTPSDSSVTKNEPAVTQPSIAGSGEAPPNEDSIALERSQSQTQESSQALQSDKGVSNSTGDNSTPATSNPNQQSTATDDATAASDSQDTNSTTPPRSENTTTEAPTTTSSPVPNSGITSIASAVQKNKGNVDSSVTPVWMRTAASLLIVVVLFSATVY
ncbi:uncharacterized protein TM35_000621010 [Trypanosoma theileri]|uniref:Mucin-like glycoprotein n=1 Tax=Trypanosoma theileri TaxID=67003 RepID=A0A1X0NG36_9TRYP|nr:uncharacterized protein TM35_000621010 [Trypanosoma theileri]ORC83627.1 hypothetical protein TM35_000621010 [Trypanosoma theileri]